MGGYIWMDAEWRIAGIYASGAYRRFLVYGLTNARIMPTDARASCVARHVLRLRAVGVRALTLASRYRRGCLGMGACACGASERASERASAWVCLCALRVLGARACPRVRAGSALLCQQYQEIGWQMRGEMGSGFACMAISTLVRTIVDCRFENRHRGAIGPQRCPFK